MFLVIKRDGKKSALPVSSKSVNVISPEGSAHYFESVIKEPEVVRSMALDVSGGLTEEFYEYKTAAKESAESKLMALGLTATEVKILMNQCA